MKTFVPLALCLVVGALAAGCAASGEPNVGAAKATREYRTGSNIPVRDSPMTEEERQRAIEQASELRRNQSTGRPVN